MLAPDHRQSSFKVQKAKLADFARLEPFLKLHCERIGKPWALYEQLTKQILSNSELGLVLLCEEPTADDRLPNVTGFLTLAYRYEFEFQKDILEI